MQNHTCWPAMRMTLSLIVFLAWIVANQVELLGQDVAQVEPEAPVSPTVFGDQVVRLRYRVVNTSGRPSLLAWSVAVEGRTLAVGEKGLEKSAEGQSVMLDIPLPEVRDSVVLETSLSVKILGGEERRVLAKHSRELFIYGRNPFARQTEWLKALDIQLYDPLGDTADAMDSEEIPFERVLTADALAEVRQGIVLIGEGNSAKFVTPAVSKLVERGMVVLWLAPAVGELPIADSDDESGLTQPDRLVLCDVDVIEGLNRFPRLLAEVQSKCRFTTQSPRGLRIVNSHENELESRGWNWVECRYRQPRAVVVVCGLAVIQEWNVGPAPRYGFSCMLKYLSKSEIERELKGK